MKVQLKKQLFPTGSLLLMKLCQTHFLFEKRIYLSEMLLTSSWPPTTKGSPNVSVLVQKRQKVTSMELENHLFLTSFTKTI